MNGYSARVRVEQSGAAAGQETMATCVFVVEDNADLNRDLCEYLEMCGFDVVGCDTGAAFHRALKTKSPAAVILDIMLPDADGYELAKYARANLDCGIMMLTSLAGMDHHLTGYKSGADVYLTKDSPLSVIEAALRPLLRRVGRSENEAEAELEALVRDDHWTLDMLNWTLSNSDGNSSTLTATERTIVRLLVEANGAWLTRPEIVMALGKADTAENCRNLDTAIRRVRQKVLREVGEELPIRTAYGRGYAFTSSAVIVGVPESA
ncbi:response regulator transcription factor [Thalassospira sp. A3_1]|uniref:response regulator transcription factor n=1 Tax=Thalassospira sp. A3_1 TaxID=2821088 RepID=UPI001ADB6389|nr:response regulator transcription factor [Thalassospira sp. A3_1]MBO9508451.1 response regulator transcription factor [Thalassospira sp. A3_1]